MGSNRLHRGRPNGLQRIASTLRVPATAEGWRSTRSFARLLKPRQVERGGLMIRSVIVSLLALLFIPSSALAQSCAANPIAVQILGSGGPRVNRDRASSSYLLWIDAQARILVDIGGGAFLRFGQAQAKLSDLSLIAISHLHPDHVSDLPALLWLSHQARKDPLPIVGPSAGKGVAGPAGNDVAPDFQT